MPFGKILWIIANGVHNIHERSMLEIHGRSRFGCLQTPDLDSTEQIAQVLVLRCAVIAGLRLVAEHLQEFFGDGLHCKELLHGNQLLTDSEVLFPSSTRLTSQPRGDVDVREHGGCEKATLVALGPPIFLNEQSDEMLNIASQDFVTTRKCSNKFGISLAVPQSR